MRRRPSHLCGRRLVAAARERSTGLARLRDGRRWSGRRLGVDRLRVGLGGLGLGLFLFRQPFLERLDALGEIAHQLRDLAAPAEQQKAYGQNQNPVPYAHSTHAQILRIDEARTPVSSLGFDQKLGSARGKNKDFARAHAPARGCNRGLEAVGTAAFSGVSPRVNSIDRVPARAPRRGIPQASTRAPYSSPVRSGGGARPRSSSAGSSGSSSSCKAGSSDGIGTEKPGGSRPSSRPEPLSSSSPGRSPTASSPKCDRNASLVP